MTCADLLKKVDAYGTVEADLTDQGLMTPDILAAIEKARGALGDQVASAVQADTAPDSPLPEAITFGGKVYSFDLTSGTPHLDAVTVKDAADVPIPPAPGPGG